MSPIYVAGYVSMVVSLLFVFFGIKHFRDHENEGIISFGKALVIGVLITLIASVAFGVLDVIYVKYMNPDFLMEYYDQAIETAKNTFSGEELTLKIKEINNEKELFSNPFISFLLMAVTVFMIGFIISLLSALILQRKSTKTSS